MRKTLWIFVILLGICVERAEAQAEPRTLFTLIASNAAAQESTDWRKVAEAVPLGTKVKVQTQDGKRVSGTLMRVDDTSVMLKRNTRLPEPAVPVAFDRIFEHRTRQRWRDELGESARDWARS